MENKKPFIKGKKDLFISISHSENCVAAAVSSKPIGVDVQKIKQIKPSLIKRALTPLEQEFANSNDVSAFYRLWTAKEALIKTGEYTYSEAFNFSFVKNGKIVCPEGFKIEQRYYEDFLICTIEKE